MGTNLAQVFTKRKTTIMDALEEFERIKLIMKIGGQWQTFKKYQNEKVLLQKFRLWYLILLTPLGILSMFLLDFKDSLSKYAFFSVAGVFGAFMAYAFATEWTLSHRIYNRIRRILIKRREPYQVEMFKNNARPLWVMIKYFTYNNIGFALTYNTVPYIYDAYLAFFTESTTPFMTPLPNQGYIGRNPKRTTLYYAINIITTLWCFILSSVVYNFISMSCIFVMYTSTEMRIISMRILEWGRYGESTGVRLQDIIEEHKEIIRLATDLKLLLGAPLASLNQMGSLSLTLYAYTIMVKFKTDIILVFVNVFCLVIVSAFMTTTNYLGEKLQTEGFSIFESLTEIPWYEMPPHVRKELNMMIRQAKRPMLISYKGKSPLTLSTLMRIVNSSYSYFMVLRTMN